MMAIRFVEAGLSYLEVPNELALCIYISGCMNRCKDCHYPELTLPDEGDLLSEYYSMLIDSYSNYATCVCFLGEGAGGEEERNELTAYSNYAHGRSLKSCLYIGRDTDIEHWMHEFDYVKVGSYKPERGSLYHRTTNQKMYLKKFDKYYDITELFWE